MKHIIGWARKAIKLEPPFNHVVRIKAWFTPFWGYGIAIIEMKHEYLQGVNDGKDR